MDNQDQFNQESESDQVATVTEFSNRRRIFTAVLVLVAALLLGYVIYSMMFAPRSTDDQSGPIQPELSAEEQAMQRLRAFEQRPDAQLSTSTAEKIGGFAQDEIEPSQEQVDRLQKFQAES